MSMRKKFRTFLVVVIIIPYIIGCSSHVQPTFLVTPSVSPTATLHKPTLTLSFPPTFTAVPLPAIATVILPTATPIPKTIFDPFPREFHRNTIKTGFGTILSDEIIEYQILVDNTLGGVHFDLTWDIGNLDLTLIQPDGMPIDPSTSDKDGKISFLSDSNYKKYSIDFVQLGSWIMIVSNKSVVTTNYKIEAYSESCPMRVNVHVGNEDDLLPNIDYSENFTSGDCIKLSASVEDIILLNHNKHVYIHGAVVRVAVDDPENNRYSFELFDDGMHGDSEVDDGIYANYFCNTKTIGEYFFYFQISGVTNWNSRYNLGKLPFTREFIRSLAVH